jgi:hypothetical protein
VLDKEFNEHIIMSHRVNLLEQLCLYKNQIDFLCINMENQNNSTNLSSNPNEQKMKDLIELVKSCKEG